ncbi:MAG: 1-deoxy-D-xylulose-5-phosphate synthase N-terminal domain-containing protein [Ilumatobacter sp.]|uniref:transketolase-like TK C-terminal-containing protein n=1 Tax=Ilumatobacter sp. TaxID=1967498 RepID=UPI0026320E15|nr:1-deoxy-D-xylulose-5-phosphate synthase N-terminal domain-containing protein [Ilumatobacter sp.]MDJ0767673.1 1-deoxy-D-xylulose-5-phosphate synthase N-terminal domain-containing protein [Ilumatobacter sp.]
MPDDRDDRDLVTLEDIQRRVLWLATRIVDHANHDRPNPSGMKVGGHQASSASMVGIMTSLWFGHLRSTDKVAVKPHASPVYHAIKYLTGELDRSWLTTLRQRGGLQAYPSRTKDPDVRDFSTGSVGLGAVAPMFAAAVRRYVDAHFGERTGPAPRFIALVGDAELDEGNIWEAIADPTMPGLGNVMLVVDVNRQSLDRVIPGMKIRMLIDQFAAAGWHVVEAKYGRRLTDAFERSGGDALREHIDGMSNERYQALFALSGADLRAHFTKDAPSELVDLCDRLDDDELAALVTNLGGHDLGLLLDCYRACDEVTDRPSIVFAYTVKGWGLPIAGDPMNHAALLSSSQIDDLRTAAGLTEATEWDRFDADSPAGSVCASVGGEINNPEASSPPLADLPAATGPPVGRPVSTQETFGRVLAALAEAPDGERIVTTSPDVSISTNLGAWINKVGVFSPEEIDDPLAETRVLKWLQGPSGRHIELGISEMNLFLLLGAMGVSHDHHGEQLLPVGTVYDPFVCRGLDALIYALYSGSRFVVAGTPAGITLAPEGGAHQSTITPSIGLELPGLTYCEPTFGQAVDWLLCDGLVDLTRPDGTSLYLRLSTRVVDQTPFADAADRVGRETLREHVLAGGYRLRDGAATDDLVVLATCGAVTPEVLAAADLLASEGVAVTVLDLTSPDRLFRGWRAATRDASNRARPASHDHHLAHLIHPTERHAPIVTVHDAASHALAWLGSVFGQRVVPVGVDEFGQSGALDELYDLFDLLPEQIVNAALVALG